MEDEAFARQLGKRGPRGGRFDQRGQRGGSRELAKRDMTPPVSNEGRELAKRDAPLAAWRSATPGELAKRDATRAARLGADAAPGFRKR